MGFSMNNTSPSTESALADLVSLWQRRRAEGKTVTPDELCRDRPELLPQLEQRIAAMERMDDLAAGIHETATIEPAAALHIAAEGVDVQHEMATLDFADSLQAAVPTRWPEIPGYEVVGELGRGGMGVVYKARQTQLGRTVALKMILSGSMAGVVELARFRTEAEAIARLQHANIVQIHEVEEHDGRPFFSLEFCSGGSLEQKLNGTPLPAREAARLVQSLAQAMEAAHQAHVIHRDLKPANVLLTADGTPKITDFGLAKKLDVEGQTHTGAVMGTPSYMAPEQADGHKDIGPAADVYALGAILYELLTGRPPFKAATMLDTIMQVKNDEPVPPRRLQSKVPRDLETICLKCLQKQPSRRYASAAALADDLRRFRAGEPISAHPVGRWQRGWKWAKRRPAVAGLLAAVVVLVAVSVALVFGLWLGAEARFQTESKAKDEEARGRQENLRLLANVTLDHGLNLCARGETNHGLLVLAHALELAERAGALDVARVARVNLAVWRRRLVTPRASFPHHSWVWAVAFSPDGKTALTGGKDGIVGRWDTRTGKASGDPLHHPYPVWAASFSPDGKTILTGSGIEDVGKREGEVRLWDARSGKLLDSALPHPNEVHAATFSPNGRRILTVCDEEVRIYETDTLAGAAGRPKYLRLPHSQPAKRIDRLQPRMWAIFSPDSESVLTGGEDGTARLWDAATGAAKGEPLRHDGPVLSLAFSPQGELIVTGSYDGTARIWDAATCRQLGRSLLHLGRVHAVAVRFDKQFVATASSVEVHDPNTGERKFVGGEVRLWRPETGELIGEPLHYSKPVWSVAFSPGGGKLLVGVTDRAARFYSVVDGTLLGKPLEHESNVANVVFSPNGRLALTASAGGDNYANARLWELAPGDQATWSAISVPHEPQLVGVNCFAPDGKAILGLGGHKVREFDGVTGQPVGPVLEHPLDVRGAAFSPNGRTIVTWADPNDDVRFWDRSSGKQIGKVLSGPKIARFDFDAKGDRFALLRNDYKLAVHRVPTGELEGPLIPIPQPFTGMVLRSDGKTVFTHGPSNEAREWDVGAGKLLRVHKVPGTIRRLCFAANKPVAITGQGDHLARAYDLETGQPMSGPLTDIAGQISWIAFSPDGSSILTGVWDRHNAGLWDTATGKPIGPSIQHGEAVPFVAFTADGTRMLSCNIKGEFRSLEVPHPLPGDVQRIRCWVEILTGMELDADGTIHDLNAEALQERRERLRELGGPPDGSQLE